MAWVMVWVDMDLGMEDWVFGKDLLMRRLKLLCRNPRDLPTHTLVLDMEDFMALVDLVMDLEDYMAMVCMEATSGRDLLTKRKILPCPDLEDLLILTLALDMAVCMVWEDMDMDLEACMAMVSMEVTSGRDLH